MDAPTPSNTDTPRPAASELHSALRDYVYKFSENNNLTGFEVAGILLTLATEIAASALVQDGLLQGGRDWYEERELT